MPTLAHCYVGLFLLYYHYYYYIGLHKKACGFLGNESYVLLVPCNSPVPRRPVTDSFVQEGSFHFESVNIYVYIH